MTWGLKSQNVKKKGSKRGHQAACALPDSQRDLSVVPRSQREGGGGRPGTPKLDSSCSHERWQCRFLSWPKSSLPQGQLGRRD